MKIMFRSRIVWQMEKTQMTFQLIKNNNRGSGGAEAREGESVKVISSINSYFLYIYKIIDHIMYEQI